MAFAEPFETEGPALISFSGGRTSAYLLRRILDAHGGILPADVYVVFANTGKEREETLDFVERCSTQWRVPIAWVERSSDLEARQRGSLSIRQVNHQSASRAGEPFGALIDW